MFSYFYDGSIINNNNNIFYLINNLNLITFIKMFAYKYFYSKILKIFL